MPMRGSSSTDFQPSLSGSFGKTQFSLQVFEDADTRQFIHGLPSFAKRLF